MKALRALLVSTLLFTPLAWAGGIVGAQVSGNELTAMIELPGGVSADIKVEFENVVGLTPAALGLSSELVDPLDTSILNRLPDVGAASLPAAFPVRLHIEPPATGGLSFSGVVEISLHTHNLHYTAGTPLRMFAAHAGGDFRDITHVTASGSYRAGGSKGDFSEFIILADLRLLADVINTKYNDLGALLQASSGQMSGATYASLQFYLDASRDAFNAGNLVAAIKDADAFSREVVINSGNDIPNVWRSSRDIENTAGKLRAHAASLRYSLTLASNNL
ncbi:MAG: hypothetical protein HKN59_04325 [Gammaproteobacteria bacterium]|nr:hypothetical protein [Gammaproteobacteria bacterium]